MDGLYLFFKTLSIVLYVFDLLLLAHAICSWVPEWRMSKVYIYSSRIIDPILSPIRKLLWRFDWARRCPIDLSFIILVLLTRFADRAIWYLYVILASIIY